MYWQLGLNHWYEEILYNRLKDGTVRCCWRICDKQTNNQWSWSFSRISIFCTINERPVFTEVKGQIEQYILIPSNYTLLLQPKPHIRFYFYHRTHHSLPLSCHIHVQIMDEDNNDVHKNNARPTVTSKRGSDSSPRTSKFIYPHPRFALSSYLKSDLIIYLIQWHVILYSIKVSGQ
jgi:hypothetical protein